MTLAAQGMITREHVMDIVCEPVERYGVVASAQRVEDTGNASTDRGVKHNVKIIRCGTVAPDR
jgi:hypothetical protein